MRFDQHTDAYLHTGQFPSIHEPMVSAILRDTPEGCTFLDLGCCHGLLGVQVSTKHKARVIGVDGNAGYIKNAIPHPNVEYYLLKIDGDEAIADLCALIQSKGVQFIIARRIMPELADAMGVDGVYKLAHSLRHIGVGVFLQGRVKTKNAKNPLSSLEKESAIFQEAGYVLRDDQRGIHFLVPKSTS